MQLACAERHRTSKTCFHKPGKHTHYGEKNWMRCRDTAFYERLEVR